MTIMKFGPYRPPNVEPITTDLDWWHPVEGSPIMKAWIERQSDNGKYPAGY